MAEKCKLDQAEYTDMGPLSWDFEFRTLALGVRKASNSLAGQLNHGLKGFDYTKWSCLGILRRKAHEGLGRLFPSLSYSLSISNTDVLLIVNFTSQNLSHRIKEEPEHHPRPLRALLGLGSACSRLCGGQLCRTRYKHDSVIAFVWG